VRTVEPWSICLGYWNLPEKTAAAWRNGWFHTGDAFRRDADGNYFFVDRKKDALRRRGENVSSFEIEAAVGRHPAVAECAAVGVDVALGGQEIKIFVVRKAGAELMARELIDFLIPRMPRYMVPRFVEFVPSLPKTEATLRVQKVKLRERPLNENTWDREARS